MLGRWAWGAGFEVLGVWELEGLGFRVLQTIGFGSLRLKSLKAASTTSGTHLETWEAASTLLIRSSIMITLH